LGRIGNGGCGRRFFIAGDVVAPQQRTGFRKARVGVRFRTFAARALAFNLVNAI
jgi:hypothetical protein